MQITRLVKQAKKGNKDALLQLVHEQQDAYYRLALKYTNNAEDAMDALEEMIVILYHNISSLKKNDSFYSWSKTILVNECKRMLRKKEQLLALEEWESAQQSAGDDFTQREQRIDIEEMLSAVSSLQREAIELKYFHDLDYRTIAEITAVSIGTAKSRVFNGLKKMREKYGGDRYE